MFGSSNRTFEVKKTQKQHKNVCFKTMLLLWLVQSYDLNPVEHEWSELKRRSTIMELWIWEIWRDSGWRNDLWYIGRCSLTSSGIIGENVELLNWKMEVSKSIDIYIYMYIYIANIHFQVNYPFKNKTFAMKSPSRNLKWTLDSDFCKTNGPSLNSSCTVC